MSAEAQTRNGVVGALEDDARLTALFLWALQSKSEGTLSGHIGETGSGAEHGSGAGDSDGSGSWAGYGSGSGVEDGTGNGAGYGSGAEEGEGSGSNIVMEEEEDQSTRRRVAGYSLPFDVARRFVQPLGIHLDEWESRIIKTEKDVVWLRPVTERGKELIGESGADTLADEIQTSVAASAQLNLFPDEPVAVRGRL